MKKYIAVKNIENGMKKSNANYLEIETYYDLGGYNYFTYNKERRGYYLRVVPVERGNNMISFAAFSGVKQLLKEVARKSSKAEAEANELAKQYEQELINYVLKENNLELA